MRVKERERENKLIHRFVVVKLCVFKKKKKKKKKNTKYYIFMGFGSCPVYFSVNDAATFFAGCGDRDLSFV